MNAFFTLRAVAAGLSPLVLALGLGEAGAAQVVVDVAAARVILELDHVEQAEGALLAGGGRGGQEEQCCQGLHLEICYGQRGEIAEVTRREILTPGAPGAN